MIEEEALANAVKIGPIKDALRPVKQATQEAVTETREESSIADLKPFNKETFMHCSQLLAEQLESKGKRALAAYFKEPIFQLDNGKVKLLLGSKTQKAEIEQQFGSFENLCASEGYRLDLEYEINAKKVGEYKLFTPKEQLEALSKEYPVLKDFVERFGLDFEV